MSILRTVSLLSALVCLGSSVSQAGIFNRGCSDSCSEQCSEPTSCPSDYCCVGECKSEKVKLSCFESKCEAVVIPPVKFPCGSCFSKLCGRGGCGGCTKTGCSDCADGCSESGCGNSCSGGNGFISKLFGKFAKCRVRCVNTYKKQDYECGTKCVCTWKAVHNGGGSGCGAGCATGCTEGY